MGLTRAERYNRKLEEIMDHYHQHRKDLEQQALATVSSWLYYDLLDMIDDTSDQELHEIIACGGDVKKEAKLIKQYN
jgi:hypothetical protein